MKTLVIYDSNDPVQVAGAALLKKVYLTDVTLAESVPGPVERIHCLQDIDETAYSESMYAFAASALGYDFTALTLEADPTIFTASTLGKAGLTLTVNEHAGDWCYIKSAAADDLVMISSNTATTLTFMNDLANTPDADSEFAIIPWADIALTWVGANPAALAWGMLSREAKSYPIELMAGNCRLYSGVCDAANSTASVAGFVANELTGFYVALQDATDKRWFTRKIVSNTDAAITVDRAWDEAITNSSTAYIYRSLGELLKDIYFVTYADTYMRNPHHPYWNQLFDNEGRLADGIPTYNEALFAQILADGKVMFNAIQVSVGGSLSFLDYD